MPPRNSGGIPYVSTRFSPSMEMSRLTRDGTAEPVSRDQILRRERGQGNIHFPRPADHEQDWQPYPVDPYSCFMCDHTYIHHDMTLLMLTIVTCRILQRASSDTVSSKHVLSTVVYIVV